jgi:hypothetical protein
MRKRVPILAILSLSVMSGCGGTTSEIVTAPQIEKYRIVRIAVLPFAVAPPTLGQRQGYATPAPPPEAGDKLADLFYLKLNIREGLAAVPPRSVREAMPAVPTLMANRAMLRDLGQRLNVGAVLEGTVEVYKERKGNPLGLDRPEDAAAVGFSARLVSVKDGTILWIGEYYERQRPLTEDLSGFLERGAHFLTVDQLADSAVNHVLKGFPLGKQLQNLHGQTGTAP